MTAAPACSRDREHPSVDVRRDAGDHVLAAAGRAAPASAGAPGRGRRRCRRRSRRPPAPRSSNSPTTSRFGRRRARRADGASTAPRTPVDRAVGRPRARRPGGGRRRSTRPASACARTPALERLDDARAGAPRQVEARHGVAVARRAPAAALGPADDREEPDAPSRAARRASRPRRTRRRPPPQRRGQASSGRSNCADPSQSCSARSNESCTPIRRCSGVSTRNSPPRRPERLTAEGLRAAPGRRAATRAPGVRELGGGDQPGEPRSYDDGVGVHTRMLRIRAGRSPRSWEVRWIESIRGILLP